MAQSIVVQQGKVTFVAWGSRENKAGFSRVELLSILAILVLLTCFQLPALAHNKASSHRARCADNLRRLMLSWQEYADDNRGVLVPNQPPGSPAIWIISEPPTIPTLISLPRQSFIPTTARQTSTDARMILAPTWVKAAFPGYAATQ